MINVSKHTGHFSLWGDLDVDTITALLGIEPSWVLRKGECLDDMPPPAKSSTWDLHCPPETGDSMEEQIRTLLDLLWPKREQLKPLTLKFHADVNVAQSCEEGTSLLSLDCNALKKLAELNLNLNCFYHCDEDENAN